MRRPSKTPDFTPRTGGNNYILTFSFYLLHAIYFGLSLNYQFLLFNSPYHVYSFIYSVYSVPVLLRVQNVSQSDTCVFFVRVEVCVGVFFYIRGEIIY